MMSITRQMRCRIPTLGWHLTLQESQLTMGPYIILCAGVDIHAHKHPAAIDAPSNVHFLGNMY
jgi:hypothetical protein